MTTDLVLPSTSNPDQWDEEERALMASAGLVHRDNDGTETVAPRSVVASFLYQCERSKLDPHARQIYLIARKNKGTLVWTTQVSIDGFRVIAERSGHYAGQGDVEWLTPDGKWVDVWLPRYGDHPAAARATVYRDDFATPMRAIAHWDSYAQTNYKGELTSMWRQHGPGQIAKCAEALALRKAFPQDLSSLYTDDEMQQAENGTDGVPVVTKVQPAQKGRQAPKPVAAVPELSDEDRHAIADEFAVRSRRALTVSDARDLYREAAHRGILTYPLTNGELLEDVLRARGEHLADEEAQAVDDLPLDLEGEEVI